MLPFKAKRQQRVGLRPTKVVRQLIDWPCLNCKGVAPRKESCQTCHGTGRVKVTGAYETDA